MNDYSLINSLLEDGSEASILKLKMIFDWDEVGKNLTQQNFNIFYMSNNVFDKIKIKHIVMFFTIFDEKIKNNIIVSPRIMSLFPIGKTVEIFILYKEFFEELFKESPSTIKYINRENINEILEIFKDSLRIGFRTHPNEIDKIISITVRQKIENCVGVNF